MQVGTITVDGRQVGVVSWAAGTTADTFTPNLDGYVPMGRAAETPPSGPHAAPQRGGGHGGHNRPHGEPSHHGGAQPRHDPHSLRYGHHDRSEPAPAGQTYEAPAHGARVHPGSAETDQAIVNAARAHHLDPNTMRGIASIESGMNPGSNANRSTQYKGLYQVGRNEWQRFGNGGDIYSARENAMGAARMFDANRGQFRKHYGRDPTDAELYMMHQQGLGFYTRGAMTNISGNPYPGMHGPQTHATFEAGWGRELARRKAAFAAKEPKQEAAAKPPDQETQAP